MKFKEIITYGDLSNNVYNNKIDIRNKEITSLLGCPKEINGSLFISNNIISSLKYSPKKINGDFDCSFNHLTNSMCFFIYKQ